MDKIKNKIVKYDVKIGNIIPENSEFSRCKVYILYHGKNRNRTALDKSTVENALYSIYNIPIVGEFSDELDDFKDHGGKLVITNDDIKYVQTTRPIGCVPQDVEMSWEEVVEDDGTKHEYLVADGCILWTGRYPEGYKIVEEGKGQSMEININDGYYDEEDYLNITSFEFSGLCILGDDVEPCFEGAKAITYTLENDNFKKEYDEMMAKLDKYALGKPEGDVKENEEIKDETKVIDEKELDKTNEDIKTDKTNEADVKTKEHVEDVEDSKTIDVNNGENTEVNENEEEKTGTEPKNEEDVYGLVKEYKTIVEGKDAIIEAKDKELRQKDQQIASLNHYIERMDKRLNELEVFEKKVKAEKELNEKQKLIDKYSIGLSKGQVEELNDCMEEMSYQALETKILKLYAEIKLDEIKEELELKAKDDTIQADFCKKDKAKNKYAL